MADRLTRAAIAALGAAAAFAGWAGWFWFDAAHDEALAHAAMRDAALDAGREHVARLTTLDHNDVDAGIDRWLAVSTGALRDELAGTGEDTKRALREGGTVATGEVLDAAISELDPAAGTARMLVSVEITTSGGNGGEPATTRNRFTAQLRQTGEGWKLSALDQVPVGGGG
ncbi:hypothetical protein [Qaidamihabitans albus]|uniref:hypothetical protein n=1 Tax=Qaidamihabitans albus TaxID=2795733 RepID=UPI0018F193ED|nr:hypothetical protein [Qaidamihabitans albus]